MATHIDTQEAVRIYGPGAVLDWLWEHRRESMRVELERRLASKHHPVGLARMERARNGFIAYAPVGKYGTEARIRLSFEQALRLFPELPLAQLDPHAYSKANGD